ncbi:MAG TPA: translational GTPase TypA [Candidatus Avisuccinivibrio pullicola]|nr:translational GTPase TypA [Candidatus Avisuccinivibrio pullicola]
MDVQKIRNIAIIAHVDHGKTTLVDKLLRQSGTLDRNELGQERVMDSNAIEKERGITILSKNTAINWNGYRINIVDTPGHADFGGEVERVMSMVDSVLLLVDAVDGPMPQTRFVTQKAFARGLKPIVVINKCDRPGARPDWVIDQVFDLFDNLGATDEQLDFPIVYASALSGWASLDLESHGDTMEPLFETIVEKVAPPAATEGPFQMQVSSLDFTSYVGVIGVGRVTRGSARANQPVTIVSADGTQRQGKIGQVLGYLGLHRQEAEEAEAGDIVAVTGLGELKISDTICATNCVEALPPLTVDEPTVSMTFCVNTSPFAGREGKFITSRNIEERLREELVHNVALRVENTEDPDRFRVSGRGELHLSVLIEQMRREGYELGVSRPQVILHKDENGKTLEPYEVLTLDLAEENQGGVMEELGKRKGELKNMNPDGKGRVRLDYRIPARGLIGFQSLFMTLTSGTGLMYHTFDSYDEYVGGSIGERTNGVLISNDTGKTVPYALWFLQERGRLFVDAGEDVYEGQVIGLHVRSNDLTVNCLKTKKLTNVRAAGSDDNIILTPAMHFSLEQALEFINEDELVEVTPKSIRLRKKNLSEMERIRAFRAAGGKKEKD